jgi:hypothetical protein
MVILPQISRENFVVESHTSTRVVGLSVIYWEGRVKFIALSTLQSWQIEPFNDPLQCCELEFVTPWCPDTDSVEFVDNPTLWIAVLIKLVIVPRNVSANAFAFSTRLRLSALGLGLLKGVVFEILFQFIDIWLQTEIKSGDKKFCRLSPF